MRLLFLLLLILGFVFVHSSAQATPTVSRSLIQMQKAQTLTSQQAKKYTSLYVQLSKLSKRKTEKQIVYKNLSAYINGLNKQRKLSKRVHVVFAQVDVNLNFLKKNKIPSTSSRQNLAPQGEVWGKATYPVIFQWVNNHGWQFHPLANFGSLAGKSREKMPKHPDNRERFTQNLQSYGQALTFYQVNRGYAAYEYHFPWGNVKAPFVSGMAQGAGLRAYALLSNKIKQPIFVEQAEKMLGAFELKPPQGVNYSHHFLLYSTETKMKVGNGFAQAVLGLYDYYTLTGSDKAKRLFKRGERKLSQELSKYDTGAWSRYSLPAKGTVYGRESDLHYHRLMIEFLDGICSRAVKPDSLFSSQKYCHVSQRFKKYETQPVKITHVRKPFKKNLQVCFQADKIGVVKIAVYRNKSFYKGKTFKVKRGKNCSIFLGSKTNKIARIKFETTNLAGVKSQVEKIY